MGFGENGEGGLDPADQIKLDGIEVEAKKFAFAEPRNSDYAATAENAGKIWQRTDQPTANLKIISHYTVVSNGTWSTSDNLTENKSEAAAFGASNTSMCVAFGQSGGGGTTTNNAQLYDGVSWSNVSGGLTARTQISGAGSTTQEGIVGGGMDTGNVRLSSAEVRNGTTFTAASNISTARRWVSMVGNSASALAASGNESGGNVATVDLWNGSSWSTTTNILTASQYKAGAGTPVACVITGGGSSATLERNGTVWSTASATIAGNYSYIYLTGTQTAALYGGGSDGGGITTSQSYDGVTWTTVGSLNASKQIPATGGTNASAIAAGGPNSATTESYSAGNVVTYAVTDLI